MGWETRTRGGRYYTRSVRIGQRIVRQYLGTGLTAELAAAQDAVERTARAAAAAAWAAEQAARERADTPLAAFGMALEGMAAAALTAAGYRRHHRGEWRRRRRKEDEMNAVETATADAIPDGAALEALMRQAAGGDDEALAAVTHRFDAAPEAWGVVADLGLSAERAWIDLAASTVADDPLFRRALERRLALLRQEIAGLEPSALERLLAERVALCWLAVELADEETARYCRGEATLFTPRSTRSASTGRSGATWPRSRR